MKASECKMAESISKLKFSVVFKSVTSDYKSKFIIRSCLYSGVDGIISVGVLSL